MKLSKYSTNVLSRVNIPDGKYMFITGKDMNAIDGIVRNTIDGADERSLKRFLKLRRGKAMGERIGKNMYSILDYDWFIDVFVFNGPGCPLGGEL